jgi:ubiquinone/menaquinone biosynthesis C-methylase UbiE
MLRFQSDKRRVCRPRQLLWKGLGLNTTGNDMQPSIMDKPISNLHFVFMSLGFGFRDLLYPPKTKLIELGIIEEGDSVLDYGCGTGSYSIAAAQLVGESGKVYGLDIQPLSVRRLDKLALQKRLKNINTIQSDCATGLENDTIDVILLFDTFHDLDNPEGLLKELHRVLKAEGILCFDDHHMKEDEILSGITQSNLFTLSRKHKRTFLFSKV